MPSPMMAIYTSVARRSISNRIIMKAKIKEQHLMLFTGLSCRMPESTSGVDGLLGLKHAAQSLTRHEYGRNIEYRMIVTVQVKLFLITSFILATQTKYLTFFHHGIEQR